MAKVIQFEGQTHTFPDDFSDDEVAAALSGPSQYRNLPPGPVQRQQPIATQQAIRQQAQMGPAGRFAMGVARPVLETAYGVKELLGGKITPEQQHQLDVLRANKGVAGGAGRVAGEVATFAAPGGLVGKGASMVTRAPNAARLAGDVAVSAGMESLKAPTDERGRLRAALEGAAGAGIGHAVMAPVAPLVRGVRNVTDEARQFMQQHPNIVPTPGQMKGGFARWAESRSKALPFIGEQIKKREREAIEGWNRNVTERALPPGAGPLPKNVKTGQESIAAVQDAYGDAYDALFKGKSFDVSEEVGNRFAGLVSDADTFLPSDAKKRAVDRLSLLTVELAPSSKISGEFANRTDDNLRDWAFAAKQQGFPEEAQIYEEARKLFREKVLPKDVSKRLKEVDAAYRQWVPVERAGAYKGAGANEGIFTPSQLLGASRASSDTVRKRGFAAGKAPQQQEATLAGRVLGDDLPTPGPGTAEKLTAVATFLNPALAIPGAAGLLPYTRAGQKALAGKYPWQKPVKTLSEMLAEGGVTRATTGAAVEE